jgi:signal transduction histidine kinase
MRLRLQRQADRVLYGDRGDPYAVLTSLGRRLEAVGSAEEALPATVTAVGEALRLPYVAVALPGDLPSRPTAEHGGSARSATPQLTIPLRHGDGEVGQLVIGQRSTTAILTDGERRLLDDVARRVAVAAHAVLMDRALRKSRETLVVAREEERHRLRRDLHDGLGPALAGVALGVDAARNILRDDPQTADDLLLDLKKETLGCLVEVRRIVEDLKPPDLEQLGLLPALTAFARRLSERDDLLHVNIEYTRDVVGLPSPVEVAAYRIASEALTNVARHAAARSCRLRLDVECTPDPSLTLEIHDDGVGLPAQHGAGVGLTSMVERASELGGSCVIERPSDGGTTVTAHLPLVPA